jgi:putative intracellular protease/amidase
VRFAKPGLPSVPFENLENGKSLQGRRVAILAADGVERVELEVPRQEVQEAGAQTDLLSLPAGQIQARNNDLDESGTCTLTSFPSIRTDLRNAGAEVVDEEVVIDGNLISSRSPDDLPAFCRAIVDQFAKAPARAS